MLPHLLSLALVFLALVSSASAFAARNDTIASLSAMREMKTVLQWSRQLRTCDEVADRDIPLTGTSRLIYAIGDSDPKDDRTVAMHSAMGVKNVNLLDAAPVPAEPADTYNITLLSRPFPVTADTNSGGRPGTYYHCQGFMANVTQKAHIIRVTPQIDYANSAYVHHMLLFKCPTPLSAKDLAWAGNCYDYPRTPANISACDQKGVIAGWAVGGGEFVYPAEVGFPLGDASGPTYLMLQTHYHNPQSVNFTDSAGFALHLTHQLRRYDAGSFFMQQDLTSINIPAQQPAYEIGVYCPDACTRFPEAGVQVFASMLHTHETGAAVWTEHFRNGTQLPSIDENMAYDFNFQQVVTFSPDAYPVLKKGDNLKLNCRYNTMKRTNTTRGGIATTDEMCMDYIWHFPALPLDACTGVSARALPGRYTATCNYGTNRTWVNNFIAPNVTTPLPDQPCTAAAQGNRSYTGDGTAGTTAISTAQWLADKASFARSMVLDDQGAFVLYWNVSLDADGHNGVVRFAAEVATPGWFGLGFSASGAMIDADSVIGWVHTTAEGAQQVTVDMTDRYNERYGRPPVDASQDIFDVRGVQDMLPVVVPRPNPIYYNYTQGVAPCHHCVPDDESSSSSSSTGPAIIAASSSSSSSSASFSSSSSSVAVTIGPPVSSSAAASSSSPAGSVTSSSSSVAPTSSSATPYVTSSVATLPPMPVSSSSTGAGGGSSSSSGLTAGSIAGIVIGSVFGALLFCALLAMLMLFMARKAPASSREDVSLVGLNDDDVQSSSADRRRRRGEMGHGLLAGQNSTLL